MKMSNRVRVLSAQISGVVFVIGYAFGDHILTTLSYLFLVCFLVVFYYALNIDLAHKSWIVAGSGVILLVVRWIAGYCRPKEMTT